KIGVETYVEKTLWRTLRGGLFCEQCCCNRPRRAPRRYRKGNARIAARNWFASISYSALLSPRSLSEATRVCGSCLSVDGGSRRIWLVEASRCIALRIRIYRAVVAFARTQVLSDH